MLKPKSPRQLLFTRKSAAALLDTSVDTIKRLERAGRLTRVRLTGPRSEIYFRAAELYALAQEEMVDA